MTATELAATAATRVVTGLVEVVDGGPLTTVQDVPGRIGLWHVGVPPSGPMDDLAHRLANLVVGNAERAAALELTTSGPTLRFAQPTVVALGGAAMRMSVGGRAVPSWTAVDVPAGAAVRIGPVDGPGMRATLAVRGGLATEPYLGSRATFTLGAFGGHDGRALVAGDELAIADDGISPPGALPPGLAPVLGSTWDLGVLVGPHTAPDFLSHGGWDDLVRAEWTVHFNSARTGVRLVGPRPGWRAPTAARPASTRRTSTTPGTPSVPSTSPATCRSSSVPTDRASAASCARRSSPPRNVGSSDSWRQATASASCRGRPSTRPSPTGGAARGWSGRRRRPSHSPVRHGTSRFPARPDATTP